jgi:hypothetical protein
MYSVKMSKVFQPFRCDDLIRLGKAHDGGYLVNIEDVKKTKRLITFGVGSDVSFEKEFAELNPCTVDAYDSVTDYKHEFFDGNTRNHHAVNVSNYNSWNSRSIKHITIENDSFIKCDIEGDEYKILDDLINVSHRLSGLIVEVHNINNQQNYDSIINFISKIDLKLIHVHINNYFYYIVDEEKKPDILELSFSSSNNLKYDPNIELPHKLDMNNNPQGEEFRIYY